MYPIYLLGSSLGRCWLGINWSFQQIRGESGESCSTLLPAAAAGWLNGEIRLNFLWRPELREDILMTCPSKGPKHFGLVQNRFSIWSRSSSIFSQLKFTFQTMSKLKINFGSVPKQCRLVQNCIGLIEGQGNTYSDGLSFYMSKTILDHDKNILGHVQINLVWGANGFGLDQKWLSSTEFLTRVQKVLI